MENLKCSSCGYVAPSGFDLKAHIDYNHFQEAKSKLSSITNNSQKKCCFCDYVCSSNSDLETHEDEMHIQSSWPSNDNSNKPLNTEALLVAQSLGQELVISNDAKTASENIGPEQIQEIVLNEPKSKNDPPFKCAICVRKFSTEKKWKSHSNSKKHLKVRVDILDKQMFVKNKEVLQVKKQLKEVTENNSFLLQLQEADNEEDATFIKDSMTSNVVRMTGFNFNKQTPNKTQAQNFLKKIFPEKNYQVTKVKKMSNKDIYHVWMSQSTDAAEIYTKFTKLSKLFQEEILRVTCPATTIRFTILKVLATKLEKRFKTNFPYVDYINCKPFLFLQKDGVEKTYKFTAALLKFRNLIHQLDFSEVKFFADTHKIQGKDLKHFIVL